jgi:hypothetical protein
MTGRLDRSVLQQLARDRGVPMGELLVMDRNNDPFNCGTPAEVRDAEWFAGIWDTFDLSLGAHLRRVHYAVLGRAALPSGAAYENTEACWRYLLKASAKARILGLVDAGLLVDRRNAEPVLMWEPRPEPWPAVEWEELAWRIPRPSVHPPMLWEPDVEVGGYDLDPGDHPVHVEVWIEKSTMNDVLVPVCQRLGVNLVAGSGYTSHTRLVELVDRARHGRPVRILYVSDFDPAGAAMPVAAARYVEFVVANSDLELDIAMTPLALTAQQCIDHELPRIPIKDSDNRRGRFEERHGEGATELDALEALHPGALARIVAEAVEPYRDRSHRERLDAAHLDATAVAEGVRRAALADVFDELGDVRRAARAAHDRLLAAIGPAIEVYEAEVAPLRDRLADLEDRYRDTVDDLDVELPERPPAVAEGVLFDGDWLYRSDRNYLAQLDAYRRAGR